MKDNKSPNFFEPRTIIAFALTMLIFVLWQNYMKEKYPHMYSKTPKEISKTTDTVIDKKADGSDDESAKSIKTISADSKSGDTLSDDKNTQNALANSGPVFEVKNFDFKSDLWSAEISNSGLEFKNIQLNQYKDRKLEKLLFKNLFKTTFFGVSDPIPFVVTQNKNQVVGEYQTSSGKIIKTLNFNPSNYSVEVNYEITGDLPGLSLYLELPINEKAKSSLFFPTFERQEFVVLNNDGEDRDLLKTSEFASRSFNQVKMVSLGTQFFSNAIVDRSTLKPNALVYINESDKKAFIRLDYEVSKNIKSFKINQVYFAGPKDDVILKSVDGDLISLINFGMFKIICEPILYVLKFFFSIFSNYGIAIILLTLLMRLLVFPIAYRGYKSIDKMQKIQPLLKQIREKNKDDSQKANLETMALMKEHKVNPVGGCLPMLLQLPIFFAFYRVLSESIVMYQSPFIFWINDLSLKDSLYILPVLMGATMFIQQKLTPTSLEPMQQKVMMFMPLIFSVFMISLPSALTLYIFVSTLFGVLQQYLFTKSK